MKIYTSTFDLAYPSNSRFWVAQNSDFKIGIKITNKGVDYTGEFTLKSGTTTFTADEDKTAGFTTYTVKSLTPGGVTYTVEVPGAQQKFMLMQIVTDSTVFEVGALSGGGDVPADVATQSWVNSQISDFITEETLTAYATKNDLTSKADVSSLTDYATTDSLTAYATKDDISSLSDVSLSAQEALSTALDIKDTQIPSINTILSSCVKHISGGEAPEVYRIITAYESEWETLSADTDENTFYVVLPDPVTP